MPNDDTIVNIYFFPRKIFKWDAFNFAAAEWLHNSMK